MMFIICFVWLGLGIFDTGGRGWPLIAGAGVIAVLTVAEALRPSRPFVGARPSKPPEPAVEPDAAIDWTVVSEAADQWRELINVYVASLKADGFPDDIARQMVADMIHHASGGNT